MAIIVYCNEESIEKLGVESMKLLWSFMQKYI